MAEVLPLGDLALMPAAKQQRHTAGARMVLEPLAGQAEAAATAALQLLVVEERPVLGAEIGGGHLPGGGRRSAGHGAVRRSTPVLAQADDAGSPLWRRDEGVTRRKGVVDAAGAAPLRACVDRSLAATGDGAGWVSVAAGDVRATARPVIHSPLIVARFINTQKPGCPGI